MISTHVDTSSPPPPPPSSTTTTTTPLNSTCDSIEPSKKRPLSEIYELEQKESLNNKIVALKDPVVFNHELDQEEALDMPNPKKGKLQKKISSPLYQDDSKTTLIDYLQDPLPMFIPSYSNNTKSIDSDLIPTASNSATTFSLSTPQPVSILPIPKPPRTEYRENVTIKALLTEKESGIVIGKAGRTVNHIRDQTKTIINMSPRAAERVISIKGNTETCSKAFGFIAYQLGAAQQYHEEQANKPISIADPALRTVTVNLLIPQSRVGKIIGKQGAKIKEIQEVSLTKAQMAKDFLPNCTEKLFTITGMLAGIEKAVSMVSIFMEDLDKDSQNRPYVSGQQFMMQQQPMQAFSGFMPMQQQQSPYGQPPQTYQQQFPGYGYQQSPQPNMAYPQQFQQPGQAPVSGSAENVPGTQPPSMVPAPHGYQAPPQYPAAPMNAYAQQPTAGFVQQVPAPVANKVIVDGVTSSQPVHYYQPQVSQTPMAYGYAQQIPPANYPHPGAPIYQQNPAAQYPPANYPMHGQVTVHMIVPTTMAGLIIGKGILLCICSIYLMLMG